jgi:hypothetical protein
MTGVVVVADVLARILQVLAQAQLLAITDQAVAAPAATQVTVARVAVVRQAQVMVRMQCRPRALEVGAVVAQEHRQIIPLLIGMMVVEAG